MPPINRVASSVEGSPPSHSCNAGPNCVPNPADASVRSSTRSRASGSASASPSSSTHLEHLDAALGERIGERVVLLPRALHPDHVVEQQIVLVARRQPLELEPRTVHEHRPERADLRVHPGRRVRDTRGDIDVGLERAHGRPTVSSWRSSLVATGCGAGTMRSTMTFLDWLHLM